MLHSLFHMQVLLGDCFLLIFFIPPVKCGKSLLQPTHRHASLVTGIHSPSLYLIPLIHR